MVMNNIGKLTIATTNIINGNKLITECT